MEQIQTHRDLKVFRLSFDMAMNIFEISKQFPKEEKYSLTNQIRRSSRSACGNIAEAFRKGKYSKAFVAKLSDAEGESAETQVWLKFAFECNYIEYEIVNNYYNSYDHIIGMLVIIAQHPYSGLSNPAFLLTGSPCLSLSPSPSLSIVHTMLPDIHQMCTKVCLLSGSRGWNKPYHNPDPVFRLGHRQVWLSEIQNPDILQICARIPDIPQVFYTVSGNPPDPAGMNLYMEDMYNGWSRPDM